MDRMDGQSERHSGGERTIDYHVTFKFNGTL